MTTFFAVRDEIAKKLEEISDFRKIYTPLNSVNVTEMSQVTPSAHVNFVRIDLKDSKGNSKLNQIGQQWSVTVACRNAQSQLNDGSAVADEAGALTEKVIQLLAGWKPSSSRIPLRFLSVRDGYSSSFAYITIIFESEKFI
ncbi:phage tail terminator protein [Acinetobacter towneri]|uniref:phage tail terminator protein n=1 Tax=Acinetobacter towneri TaxID=202956 RepID=UPI0034D6A76D